MAAEAHFGNPKALRNKSHPQCKSLSVFVCICIGICIWREGIQTPYVTEITPSVSLCLTYLYPFHFNAHCLVNQNFLIN